MRWISLLVAGCLGACGGDDGLDKLGGTPETLTAPYRVWAFADDNVWILDGTSTIHRFNGASWDEIAAPTGVSCIYALSPTDVWLCASTSALHYDGATFTESDVTTPTGLDGLTALWASSDTDVWAVGDDGIVAHYTGTTWDRTLVGSPFKTSVWGSGPTDVYALSTFDLFHYDGAMWTEVTLDGGGAGDGQVWGTSASDVWLSTDGDSIYHYDGNSWTEEMEVGDNTSVWGSGPDDVWAVGTGGSVLHYDGAWHEVAHQKIGAPYLQQLLSVHGSSTSNVWVVGRQLGDDGVTGLIYRVGS
jgi:hypothetical protein